MKITLKYNEDLQSIDNENNNNIVLTFEEERTYRDYIVLAKKEYERLKAEIYNDFKNKYKGDFDLFAEFINTCCNSGEAEVIETTFGDKLLPFHLIGECASIDGVIASYGIIVDPHIVYCDTNNLYNVNVKENTIQVDF